MEFTDEPEAVFEIVPTTRTPGMVWPIGLVISLGVLVAFSVGSPHPPVDSATEDGAGSVVEATSSASPLAGVPEPRSELIVFLPEADQVILGSSIAVAGRLAPHGRTPRSAVAGPVSVVVLDGERVIGAGEISILNNVFIGCITVDAPATKGRAVRISLAVATRAGDPSAEVAFILGPESVDRTEDASCASDPRQVRGAELRSGS